MHNERRLLARLALAAGLAAVPSPAQDAAVPDDARERTPRFDDVVDVEAKHPVGSESSTAATRRPVPIQDLPLSVTVVPRRLLDEQAATILGDALTNVSGVNVATGFGVFDHFVIRGFDSLEGGLVLTDAVPEPESTYYPLYNIRQVEVLKGPASFLHGGNPLAGAVQLTRKQPDDGRFAEVVLGYGRYGTYDASFDGNAATRDGRLAVRLNATRQGTAGYRDLPDASLTGVNPTVAWRPDERTRLVLDLEYVNSEWPPDTGIPFVGQAQPRLARVPRTRSYQSSLDASDQDVVRIRLHAKRRLGDRLSLSNRLYYTELEWHSDGTLLSGVFPGQDGRLQVARSIVFLDDRQRLLGNQLELQARFDTGGLAHELLVGVELRRLDDRFTQDVGLLPPLDLLDPVEVADPPPVFPLPLGLAGDSRSRVLAPYLIDRVRLSDRFDAFAGARLDVLDHRDPVSATERDATRLDPMLALRFAATESLAFHANWARGSAPPSTQVVGPRDLEHSRQLEVGGKLGFGGGRGFAALSYFDLRRDNVPIPDTTGITRQQGDQRSRGLELDAAFQALSGWETRLNYAFTDAELTRFSELQQLQPPDFVVLDRSGNGMPFAPRHILNAWVSKRVSRGFRLAGGVRHVSDQFVAADNAATIDAYTTLDAMLGYDRPRWGVQLHFENLTGTEYETRGFGALSVIPARPFEVQARVRMGFGAR